MGLKYVYLKVMNIVVILVVTTRKKMWMRQTFGTGIHEAMTMTKTVNLSVQRKKTDCG